MTESFEERRERLRHRTFVMTLQILIVFGVPAFGAYFLGVYLDQRFDMRPYGSVVSGVLALIISWTITIRIYRDISNAFKALEKEEEVAEQAKRAGGKKEHRQEESSEENHA